MISIKNEKRQMDLEYNLICDFIKLRNELGLSQSQMAKLYGVETKRINEAVKNNSYKFPERFSWIITKDEVDIISRSKISTLNDEPLKRGRGQNIKYLPRVFTEQGVAMLATILKSKIATQVSIKIMDAFVAMRKYISNNLIEQKYINNLVIKHDERISLLEKTFDHFKHPIMKFISMVKFMMHIRK